MTDIFYIQINFLFNLKLFQQELLHSLKSLSNWQHAGLSGICFQFQYKSFVKVKYWMISWFCEFKSLMKFNLKILKISCYKVEITSKDS